MDRIMQCNQLLIQAPRMIVDFGRVAQAGIPLARRQQVADTYLEWYTLGQRVILDELRTYFESRYTAAIGGSLSIQDMLIRLVSTAEDDLRHLWVQSVGFKWSVEEQCEVLRMTRREIFPRQPQIPYDTRLAIATICKRLYYESSIERLFVENGCLLPWWMPPLKAVPSKRMTLVMGWFDGIVLAAPERELTIARAVCQEILRKPGRVQQVREEVLNILQQLAPPNAAPVLPVLMEIPRGTARHSSQPIAAGWSN
jgi:hypothetical protein